jgi:LysM repeat protein
VVFASLFERFPKRCRTIAAICGTGALVFGGCARNDSYFGDRPSSRLSGPSPSAPVAAMPQPKSLHTNNEPFGTYRGGRDPRTGVATSAPPWQTAPGQHIQSPAQLSGTQSSRNAIANSITVQPGDTLYGIAQKHHVSISALMSMNTLAVAAIQPGQILRVR